VFELISIDNNRTAIGLQAATHMIEHRGDISSPILKTDINQQEPHRKKAKKHTSHADWSSIDFAEMKRRSDQAIQDALAVIMEIGMQPTPNKRPSNGSQISPAITTHSKSMKSCLEAEELQLFSVGEMVEVARRKMPGE
jgi:hypothetical protein